MKISMSTYNGPCIYKIWTTDDPERVYIGKTNNYSVRSKRHFNDFKSERHGNIYMQRLFNKGLELNICPLDFCKKDILSSKEEFWVDLYKSNVSGYNLSKGGESIPDELLKWSKERKESWSKYCSENPIAKGVKRSKTWHEKMQASIKSRREAGTLFSNLDKPCIVTNIKSGISVKYKNMKEAAISSNLAYTYMTEKLKKGNGSAIIKQFKIVLNG
jgi:hypothetical protein